MTYTVDLCTKGPSRKGIPLIRKIISGHISYFPIHFCIGYNKGISIYGKNWDGPMKPLGNPTVFIKHTSAMTRVYMLSRLLGYSVTKNL